MDVDQLLKERADARDKRDWVTADMLRDSIEQLGYRVRDSREGQVLEQPTVDNRRLVVCECGHSFRTYHPSEETCREFACLFASRKVVQ